MTDTSKHPRLKKCPICHGKAEIFSRWRYVGSQPGELIYIWVECNSTPPCVTGECHKSVRGAVTAWNQHAAHNRPVIHICGSRQMGKATRTRKATT
jgi:hypothetical protein